MTSGSLASGNGESPAGAGDRAKSVDETWKDKTRREKETLESEPAAQGSRSLPAASFVGLLEELSLRAAMGLGQLPNPLTGEPDLPAAKYTIDLLDILEKKTKGNVSTEEAAALSSLLQQLRMVYVHVSNAADSSEATSPLTGDPESGDSSSGLIV